MEYEIDYTKREIVIYREKDFINPMIIDFDTFLEIMGDIQSKINEYTGNIL